VVSLAERLTSAGHHAVVATTTPVGIPPGGAPVPAPPYPVVRLAGWSSVLIRRHARPEQRFHPTAPDPGLVRSLAGLCRRERVELVHAHGWMAHSAVAAARRAGVPVVVSLHDYGLDCAVRSRSRADGTACPGARPGACLGCAGARYGPARAGLLVAGLVASRRWWPSVSAFVANSASVAQAATAAGVACEVIPPWLAPQAAPDAAPVAGLPAGDFVAFVGALARHKGVAVLADAWRPGPGPAPLVALVARPEAGAPALPPGTVVHTDVDHPRVLATLSRAAVTVVPSTYAEPFGLVAVESMWAGSPVVASDTGGLRDVLDGGRAGVLVPPGDARALRAAVTGLLADPERRRALAAAGRRRARRLDGLSSLLRVYTAARGDQPQAAPASLRT
jgi:glycosyltransferase involved in cell wall biosynthesis